MEPSGKPDIRATGGAALQLIGAAIRRLREQRGLTLAQLAGGAGISYQYLSGIETGKENFSIRILERLATALELSLAALVAAAYERERRAGPGKAA